MNNEKERKGTYDLQREQYALMPEKHLTTL